MTKVFFLLVICGVQLTHDGIVISTVPRPKLEMGTQIDNSFWFKVLDGVPLHVLQLAETVTTALECFDIDGDINGWSVLIYIIVQ